MTDDATPKRIRRRRPTKYPAQLALMVPQDLYDDIEREAVDGRSKGDVGREWLEAGREALRRNDADDAPVDADSAAS